MTNQPLILVNIPLEVRHHIFKYVAVRNVEPRLLLRHWFEKKEVKEKTAELVAKNPNAGAPRVVYEGDRFEQEGEHEEEDSEDEDSGDEDSEDEDSEDEDSKDEEEGDSDENDGEEDSNEDDEEEVANEDQDDEADEEDAEMDEANSTAVLMAAAPAAPANAQPPTAATSMISNQSTESSAQASTSALVQAETTPAAAAQDPASRAALQANVESLQDAMDKDNEEFPQELNSNDAAAAQAHNTDNDQAHDTDVDMDDGDKSHDAVYGTAEEDDDQNSHGEDDQDSNEENAECGDEETAAEDGDADTAAGAVRPPPPAPVISAHRKWRHIPQFMRITHCPPPVELLLTSRQLNTEAKSWFYNVAILRIDATASFAHTSFFEEAFSQITEAALSPMEDIRKVEVTFVWDSTWLRSEPADCAAAIFPALLRQRASFVVSILEQAPNLSSVLIHWHDSAEDGESVDFMNDVLLGFLGLKADVEVEPHYIAADAKPYRKSVAGRRRIEFQNIVDIGLDRLF